MFRGTCLSTAILKGYMSTESLGTPVLNEYQHAVVDLFNQLAGE